MSNIYMYVNECKQTTHFQVQSILSDSSNLLNTTLLLVYLVDISSFFLEGFTKQKPHKWTVDSKGQSKIE